MLHTLMNDGEEKDWLSASNSAAERATEAAMV